MAKILLVNIKHDLSPEQLANSPTATPDFASAIASVPGLQWKIWIGNEVDSEAGGVYLFEDEASALAYLNGSIFSQVRNNPGFTEVTTKLYDINEAYSLITNAPLPVRQTA